VVMALHDLNQASHALATAMYAAQQGGDGSDAPSDGAGEADSGNAPDDVVEAEFEDADEKPKS